MEPTNGKTLVTRAAIELTVNNRNTASKTKKRNTGVCKCSRAAVRLSVVCNSHLSTAGRIRRCDTRHLTGACHSGAGKSGAKATSCLCAADEVPTDNGYVGAPIW